MKNIDGCKWRIFVGNKSYPAIQLPYYNEREHTYSGDVYRFMNGKWSMTTIVMTNYLAELIK